MKWNERLTLKELIEKPITGEWGTESENGEKATKVIRTTNFTNRGKLNLSKGLAFRKIEQKKIDKKTLKYGDIIIEKSGGSPKQPVGRVVFFDIEEGIYLCNNFTAVLRPKKSVHPKFLLYQLFALHGFNITKSFQNKTTGIINLQLDRYLKTIKIPLPPLKTQQQIANLLDTADDLRRTTAEQLQQLDDLVESVFLEMFGDPVVNERGWNVKKLKNIASTIRSGTTPKGGSKVYVPKGITFFRSQNVWRNNLKLNNVAYIDDLTHKKMSKSSLRFKDILMTKTGRFNTENSSLGRAAMYLGEDDKANVNGHVYLIRLHEEVINEFVLFIITTDIYREYIRSVCVGGIDKRQINKEHLEEFPIIFPPIDLQNEFATIIKNIEDQKTALKKALEDSEDLFNGLLQTIFS